jgi:hypothetical protein
LKCAGYYQTHLRGSKRVDQPEVGGPQSEVVSQRNQKSAFKKWAGILNHAAEILPTCWDSAVRSVWHRTVMISFLLPVNVVAKLGMETFDVKAKHAVDSQLAQLSGISGSKGGPFFVGEIVFPHYGLEIREGSFNTGFAHFEIKE